MLTHPTLDLLHSLGLHGMAKGFKELDAQPEARSLEHAEWLALLLEQEKTQRQQKRFESRARAAKLRHAACVEDVDYRAIRGLDRALFLKLAAGDWIRERHNLLVTGPCGVGKSWLACALGHKACRDDFAVAYRNSPAGRRVSATGRRQEPAGHGPGRVADVGSSMERGPGSGRSGGGICAHCRRSTVADVVCNFSERWWHEARRFDSILDRILNRPLAYWRGRAVWGGLALLLLRRRSTRLGKE